MLFNSIPFIRLSPSSIIADLRENENLNKNFYELTKLLKELDEIQKGNVYLEQLIEN